MLHMNRIPESSQNLEQTRPDLHLVRDDFDTDAIADDFDAILADLDTTATTTTRPMTTESPAFSVEEAYDPLDQTMADNTITDESIEDIEIDWSDELDAFNDALQDSDVADNASEDLITDLTNDAIDTDTVDPVIEAEDEIGMIHDEIDEVVSVPVSTQQYETSYDDILADTPYNSIEELNAAYFQLIEREQADARLLRAGLASNSLAESTEDDQPLERIPMSEMHRDIFNLEDVEDEDIYAPAIYSPLRSLPVVKSSLPLAIDSFVADNLVVGDVIDTKLPVIASRPSNRLESRRDIVKDWKIRPQMLVMNGLRRASESLKNSSEWSRKRKFAVGAIAGAAGLLGAYMVTHKGGLPLHTKSSGTMLAEPRPSSIVVSREPILPVGAFDSPLPQPSGGFRQAMDQITIPMPNSSSSAHAVNPFEAMNFHEIRGGQGSGMIENLRINYNLSQRAAEHLNQRLSETMYNGTEIPGVTIVNGSVVNYASGTFGDGIYHIAHPEVMKQLVKEASDLYPYTQ